MHQVCRRTWWGSACCRSGLTGRSTLQVGGNLSMSKDSCSSRTVMQFVGLGLELSPWRGRVKETTSGWYNGSQLPLSSMLLG